MAHPEAKYPYERGKYGFDIDRLLDQIDVSSDYSHDSVAIPTESGKSIDFSYYNFSSQFSVRLFPSGDLQQGYLMIAEYDKKTRQLHFILRTKSIKNGQYHKDMFAREFVETFFSFCERRDIKVDSVLSKWYPDSTNLEQFTANLKQGEVQFQAASQTWSGRLYDEYGFNVASVEEKTEGYEDDDGIKHISESYLEVLFTRSTSL